MNKKWMRNWKIYGSVGLVAATMATTTSICVSNTNTNNIPSSQSNSQVQTNNDQSLSVVEPKTAADGDFLLSSENAIITSNAGTTLTSTSTTNGPRGFLTQVGRNINYVGYDGKTIWSKANIIPGDADALLISSHYNVYANCFVVLYGCSSVGLSIASINETSGNLNVNSNKYPIDNANNTKYNLLIPIYEPNGITVKSYWVVRQYTSLNDSKNMFNYSISSYSGVLNYESSKSGTPNIWGENDKIWLAAGAINYNGYTYSAILLLDSDGDFGFKIFEDLSYEQTSSYTGNISYYLTHDNKWIDTNIPEVHMKLNSADQSITITSIINAEISKTSIKSCQYNITANTVTNNNILNLSQPGILNYDIYKGRIYGDYLYAYLGQADYGQSGSKDINKVMRLNLSNQADLTWSTTGLQWNDNYTNQRIILYDSPYNFTSGALPQTLGLPIYSTNYNGANNLFCFSVNGSANKRLYLLDGTKAAYAYETKAKNNSYNFHIAGVDNTLVQNANNDLSTYFTNTTFTTNFTQYQTGSTYTISKKTGADDILENKKGNIPATLLIDKGYDNKSFFPVAKSIDIVLTGFKEVPKPTSVQATTASINLLDVYPYQIQDNATLDSIIKNFIITNILTGITTGITSNNIASYAIKSYNNKTGKLILYSVTLNKWYDENGDIQNINKPFFLPNNADIEIIGFKSVIGQTNKKPNNIGVTDDLLTMTTNDVTDRQLQSWVNSNKNLVLDNLPPEVNNIIVSNIVKKSSVGTITIDATIPSYFDNNDLYSYLNNPKTFTNITLTGFRITSLATTTQVPIASVTGILTTLLPQSILTTNTDFKQYLFNNIIVDPAHQLTVDDIIYFTGTYDNTKGTYTLNSLTMDRVFDQDGNTNNIDSTFDNLAYLIKGFRTIVITTTINVPLIIPEFATTSVLNVSNIDIRNWLANGTNIKQAFVPNSLPDNFQASNIIRVEIIPESIIPSAGILRINIIINNFYKDAIGTLTTTNSTPFELSIAGFKSDSLATSVNTDPTAITAYPGASNILAQSMTFNSQGFKDYLFNHVLVDPSRSMTIDDISTVSRLTANNIDGTLSFQLRVNKRIDVDGYIINGLFTFPEIITINGFRKITATDVNSAPIIAGDENVLANEATEEQYTKTVIDNYASIFISLPENFNPNTNIISIKKLSADNPRSELKVSIEVNQYYAPVTGLITSTPTKTFTVTIGGYKTFLISAEKSFDIFEYDPTFSSKIAGAVLLRESTGSTNEVELTKWLRSPKVFKRVIPDSKGLNSNAFSVNNVTKIDNNLGAISMTLAVVGGKFAPGDDMLTFNGFRLADNINNWIDKVEKDGFRGGAFSTSDQIRDIKDQIIKLSQDDNSSFDQALTVDEIDVIANSDGTYTISINTTNIGYVNEKGIYTPPSGVPTDQITLITDYNMVIPTDSQFQLEKWVYPVLFSLAGVVGFLIILKIILVIIKRTRNRKNLIEDDED